MPRDLGRLICYDWVCYRSMSLWFYLRASLLRGPVGPRSIFTFLILSLLRPKSKIGLIKSFVLVPRTENITTKFQALISKTLEKDIF